MKKQQNHKRYMKAFVQFMRPMAAENHHFKNFKLSQQHKGVKK